METAIKETLWKQFGACIDMLENAILACPNELWDTPAQFWYNAYHCLFYLDYYLSPEPEKFSPPSPFTLSEFDPAGTLPEVVYKKEELLGYLNFSRTKCHDLIAGLTPESASKRWINEYRDYSLFEMLIYNLRHVQHHVAQLNLLLRQGMNGAPGWVSQTKIPL